VSSISRLMSCPSGKRTETTRKRAHPLYLVSMLMISLFMSTMQKAAFLYPPTNTAFGVIEELQEIEKLRVWVLPELIQAQRFSSR